MHLIVCLDDHNGMSFFGRRQSSDKVLAGHILRLVGGGRLWMSPYSASFFRELPENAVLHPEYWLHAGAEDYCFAECGFPFASVNDMRTIIVYRWNRVYPADVYFPGGKLEAGRKTVEDEFSGSSHNKITQERYWL